jgi:hypothetical protein
LIANVYCGETKLNSNPLSVEAASQLLLQLMQDGASNVWMEALAEEQPELASLFYDDNFRTERDMSE